MKLLICTDGSLSSLQPVGVISYLTLPTNTHITVLGVSESKFDQDHLVASMDIINNELGTKFIVDRKIRVGNPIEEILSEALENEYDLVAVGGGGGQLGILDHKLGSTTSKLARKLHTHFLVARNLPKNIRKILFSIGTEAPASMTIKLGGELISNYNAKIGLLHVLPIKTGDKNVTNITTAMIIKDSMEQKDLILDQASQQLKSAGVKGEIITRIRYGLIVEEVLKELAEGDYELLVIGAHYQPGQDRWQGALLDDVTDQLLHRCTCSVLII